MVAAPYIQDHAGPSPGLWLGLYFTAIPFGTCVGYGYGAVLASSAPFGAGWAAAFWLEALMMAPLMLLCFALPPDIHQVRGCVHRLGRPPYIPVQELLSALTHLFAVSASLRVRALY